MSAIKDKEEEKKRDRGPFMYVILVLMLLLINGGLFYSTFQNKEKNNQLTLKKEEADRMIQELNAEVNDYLLRLESYRSDNEELTAIRDSLKQVVLTKQKEIQKALHEKNFTTQRLNELQKLLGDAQREIQGLKEDKNRYLTQLDSVSNVLEELQFSYQSLEEQFNTATLQSQNLRSERDSIAQLGSVLQAVNISGTGVRGRKSGEESETPKAKRAEQLKICFDLLENRLLGSGQQTLYLKITGPGGLTLASSDNVFINRENGQESMYSNRFTFEFQNDPSQRFCTYWEQSTEFTSGTYKAELFHKGYSIGSADFELK
jgi:hypothetical protein